MTKRSGWLDPADPLYERGGLALRVVRGVGAVKGCHDLCALWGKDHSRAGWREVIMATERKHCRRPGEGWSMVVTEGGR